MSKNQLKENYYKYRFVPYSEESERINKVLQFFQYYAPAMPSSFACNYEPTYYDSFIEVINTCYITAEFISSNQSFIKIAQKNRLDGFTIDIRKNQLICKRKKKTKVNVEKDDCQCFLRHLRNAIAHGNTYGKFIATRTYLIFEDYDYHGSEKVMTAKIVVSKTTLEKIMKAVGGKHI
ncbi:MAG: hypothetical protein IKG47_11920 [Oscillospiraceae bacterium]|nr:hypothetical protein [Oscillospiraceae bacterium]